MEVCINGRYTVRAIGFSALAGVSMLCLAAPGYAQEATADEATAAAMTPEGEIIVTARFRSMPSRRKTSPN
jgi:hypothetical protein